MDGPDDHVAEWGSLTPGAAEDLRLLMRFMADRDKAFDRIYGPKLRRSPVNDTIIRYMVLEFGEGRVHPLAYYKNLCSSYAAPNTIKSRIYELMNAGVLILAAAKAPKPSFVFPTYRTISFYNKALPSLRDEAIKLLCRN